MPNIIFLLNWVNYPFKSAGGKKKKKKLSLVTKCMEVTSLYAKSLLRVCK